MKEGLGVKATGQVLLITLLWALCYPLIDVAVQGTSPLMLGAIRALLGGLCLLGVGTAANRPQPPRDTWSLLCVSGLALTTLGFAGMFLAGGRVTPGLATVLANVQPLIAAVIGFFVLGESIRGVRGLALVVGFAGIVTAASPTASGPTETSILGIGWVLLGAVGVAVGNVLLKRIAQRVDPIVATGWQLVLGSLPLFALSLIIESQEEIQWSLSSIAALATLAFLGTALAFALWLDLLKRYELIRLNVYSFMTPVFGLLIGRVFFQEHLSRIEWVGVLLIVASLMLTTFSSPRRRRVQEETSAVPFGAE